MSGGTLGTDGVCRDAAASARFGGGGLQCGTTDEQSRMAWMEDQQMTRHLERMFYDSGVWQNLIKFFKMNILSKADPSFYNTAIHEQRELIQLAWHAVGEVVNPRIHSALIGQPLSVDITAPVEDAGGIDGASPEAGPLGGACEHSHRNHDHSGSTRKRKRGAHRGQASHPNTSGTPAAGATPQASPADEKVDDAVSPSAEGQQAKGKKKKTKRKGVMCEHQVLKLKCGTCGLAGTCEHGRKRRYCYHCGPSWVCEHHKQRTRCVLCGGKARCEHGKLRSYCKVCGGSQLCEHAIERYRCKDCKGKGICAHGRRRTQCKDCQGSQYCPHKRLKRRCFACGAEGVCKHNRLRVSCAVCGDGDGTVCEHARNIRRCLKCRPSTEQEWVAHLARKPILVAALRASILPHSAAQNEGAGGEGAHGAASEGVPFGAEEAGDPQEAVSLGSEEAGLVGEAVGEGMQGCSYGARGT